MAGSTESGRPLLGIRLNVAEKRDVQRETSMEHRGPGAICLSECDGKSGKSSVQRGHHDSCLGESLWLMSGEQTSGGWGVSPRMHSDVSNSSRLSPESRF